MAGTGLTRTVLRCRCTAGTGTTTATSCCLRRGRRGRPITWPGEDEERARVELLAATLRKQFERRVEVRYVGVRDVIDFPDIRARVEAVLEELADDEIDVFVSPGTGTMQTAWYFAHFGLGLRTRLFKLRDAAFTVGDKGPERVFEEVEQSPVPHSLTIREQAASELDGIHSEGEFLLTPSLEGVYERARRVAATDRVTALVLGPSGSGKEHVARTIHTESARRAQPFVAISCAAWQNDQLLESRLFGHMKGAFTGADRDRAGAFEEAEGGTLFLDEIGDCSPALQRTLLRVLEERVVARVGSVETQPVDVRVVAATHRDLVTRCGEGRFRWDLYHRLAVAELEVPSLYERGVREVEDLLDHFLEMGRQAFRRAQALRLTAAARAVLLAYPFPGNVRELKHLVDRLYVFCDDVADVGDLPPRLNTPAAEGSLLLADVERLHILAVYERFERIKTQTARALGCSVNTLKSRLRTYGAA